jgi:hypothetical protein
VAFLGVGYLINRYELRLIEDAERALPGPLEAHSRKKNNPSQRLETWVVPAACSCAEVPWVLLATPNIW